VKLLTESLSGNLNGEQYEIQDDHALWFCNKWKELQGEQLVNAVLSDADFWQTDLTRLNGFADAVNAQLKALQNGDIINNLL
jgi:tagaturonate reductase